MKTAVGRRARFKHEPGDGGLAQPTAMQNPQVLAIKVGHVHLERGIDTVAWVGVDAADSGGDYGKFRG